jgi:hypothetical protein
MDAPPQEGLESLDPEARLLSIAFAIYLSGDDEPFAAATLVDRWFAVTPTAVRARQDLRLVAADGQQFAGEVVSTLPSLGLVAIRLTAEAAPPKIGPLPKDGRFVTRWPGSRRPFEGELRSSVDGAVAFFSERPESSPAGAPVFMGDLLVGVLGVDASGRERWPIIPVTEIVSLLGLTSSDDDQVLLSGFSPSALRALMHAYASAGEQKIHTENLLIGLYENPDGSTRRILDSRDVDERRLREVLANTAKTTPLYPGEYRPRALETLPERSDHTHEALRIALKASRKAGEERVRARHLLYGLLSLPDCEISNALESLGIHAADVQLTDRSRISGYVSDVADGRDLLGVEQEAHALASVLGAAKVEPPIAVGLLGSWGSGKSFFMRQMQKQFSDIETRGRAGDPECCSNIVQIWFNAWHYIDSNLWASLTSEIFDALDDELTRRGGGATAVDTASERARLLTESAKAQSEHDAAASARKAAEDELAQIAKTREKIDDDNHVAARVGLLTMVTASAGIALKDPDVRLAADNARKAAEDLGMRLGLDAAAVETLDGHWARLRAFRLVVGKKYGAHTLLLIVSLFVFFGALTVIAMVGSEWVTQTFAWISSTGAAVTFASLMTLTVRYGGNVSQLVRAIEPFFRAKNEIIDAERRKATAELEARNLQATERHARAVSREETASKKLCEVERELLELQPTQQMKSFVRERRESTDYTKHLGVIARAHDDFDRLSRHLATVTAPDERGVAKPLVDRIVLYIDDLDRCPENKVVDVLQAVHLLLAFPLFVVIVGVDSRWLLHSLKTQMAQFSASKSEDDADALDRTLWESTPINYLEKIFQIPFTLRPMPETGFDDLIEDLTTPVDSRVVEKKSAAPVASTEAVPTPSAPPAAVVPIENSTAAQSDGSSTPRNLLTQIIDDAQSRLPIKTPQTPHLTFTRAEVEYMKALYPLMPSPRSVKRYVNLYRLMRGLLDEYRFDAYTDERNGEYEAVLLLLAMLTGFPEETTEILRELAGRKISSPWWTFVFDFVNTRTTALPSGPPRERWIALGAKLELIRQSVKRPTETRTCDHFHKWAAETARFSFHSGRIMSDHRGPGAVRREAGNSDALTRGAAKIVV